MNPDIHFQRLKNTIFINIKRLHQQNIKKEEIRLKDIKIKRKI